MMPTRDIQTYEKSKWYETTIKLNRYRDKSPVKYGCEIISWINRTIDAPEKHCTFYVSANVFKIKFRYERDLIMFKMVWD